MEKRNIYLLTRLPRLSGRQSHKGNHYGFISVNRGERESRLQKEGCRDDGGVGEEKEGRGGSG